MRSFLLFLATGLITSTFNAQVLYDSGGFEAPRFAPGNLVGQDPTPPGPWVKDSGSSTAVVQTATTSGGAQALRVDRAANVSFAADTRWTVPTPFTPDSDDVLRVVFDLNVLGSSVPSGAFGPGFGVELYGLTTANSLMLIGSVSVDAATGEVLYQQQGTGFLLPEGAVVAFGAFNQFAITANFAALTYTIFLNGTPLHTEGFVDSGFATFSDAVLATFAAAGDPGSANASGTAFFDNYRVEIVPEPSSTVLAAVGVLTLGLWLSRRAKAPQS